MLNLRIFVIQTYSVGLDQLSLRRSNEEKPEIVLD